MKRKIAIVALSMSLMVSGMVANAATYDSMFDFTMQSHGGKCASASIRKTNTTDTAKIDFATYSNSSSKKLWYRLRSGTNDDPASELYGLNGTGIKSPKYNSGYGQKNYPYYFRIQTDSDSGKSASVSGSWRP